MESFVSLALPKGFGIELNLTSGEVRTQIGPNKYETNSFESLLRSNVSRSAARKLLSRFRWVKDSGTEVPAYRVVRCGIGVLDQKKGVEVYKALAYKKAHFGGVVSCGSVWHCAHCAMKIALRRRSEALIATQRTNESGGVCGLLTCTIPHSADEDCSLVLNKLQTLFTDLNSGKASIIFKDRYGIFGQIRSIEFTRGLNGWHPHIHSLLLCEHPVNWEQLSDDLYLRWARSADKKFGWNLPRLALDLRSGSLASDYVSKWGLESELSGAVFKRGLNESLTPFQLLERYAEGDKASGEAWVEFATSVSRMIPEKKRITSTRQLVWSRGLKQRFSITDLDDETIAQQEEEPAVLLGSLDFDQWIKVLGQPYDARVVLLQIASVGTFDDVLTFVRNLPEPQGQPVLYAKD